MFTYLKNAFVSRFDHPVLALMYVVACILAVGGIVIQVSISMGISEWGIGAGFFAVFATFFALVGTLGYALLLLGKGISVARDRMGPTS